jgi:hypothetical protein
MKLRIALAAIVLLSIIPAPALSNNLCNRAGRNFGVRELAPAFSAADSRPAWQLDIGLRCDLRA